MANDFLNMLQAASNSAASNVSAPVDGLAWLLRKAGIPVPQNALGGSDWMAQRGLTAPVQQGAGQVAGETLGLLAPMAAAARAPEIARGLLAVGENAMAPRAAGMVGAERGAVYVGKNKVYDNAYHGTAKDFKRVDFEAAADNRRNYDMGEAFWLATGDIGSNHAAAYAKQANRQGGKVKEANVFLKNPATVDAWQEATRVADQIGAPAPQSWPEAANILQYADWAKDKIDDAARAGHDALIIKRTGDAPISHDSLRLDNQLSDHLAVFKPNRVRLTK